MANTENVIDKQTDKPIDIHIDFWLRRACGGLQTFGAAEGREPLATGAKPASYNFKAKQQ